jgi:hypothetical protein
MDDNADWPAIPFTPWKDTWAALHYYTQIVGKYRLAGRALPLRVTLNA